MKLAVVATITSGILLGPGASFGQAKGHKLTDKLIARAEATIQAISDAEAQYKATLEIYNSITGSNAEDNRKAYKQLVKGIGRTEKAVATARQRADEMQSSADEYFEEWSTSLSSISSEELQERSRARLEETREHYAKVIESGQKAREAFHPLVVSLKDQVNYLGQELNPASINSLADEAQKLNEQSAAFYESLEETLREASQYIQAIRPN